MFLQSIISTMFFFLSIARFYDVNIKAEYQLSTTYNPTAFLSYNNNVRFTLKDAFKKDYKSSAIKIIPYDGKIRFEFVNEKKYMCAHKLTDDTTIFLDRNNSEDKLCEWEITGEENPHQFRIRDMCLTVQSRNRVANYHEVRLELCTDNVDQLINIAEMEKHDDDDSDEGYQSGSKSSKRKNQISSSTQKLKEETKKLASERKKLSKSISQNNSDKSKDDKSDNDKKKDAADSQSTKINVITINKTETVTFTTTATSSTTQISTIIKSTTTTVSATNSTTTTLTDTVHITNTITDTVTTTSTAKPEKVRTAKYEKLSKDDDDESSSSSDEEEIAELPFKISSSVTLKSVDGVEGSNNGKTNIDSESRVSANTRSKSKLKNDIHDDEPDTKKGLKVGRSASNLPDTRRKTGKPDMPNNKNARDMIDDRPYNPVEDSPNSNDVQVEDDSSSKTDEYQIDYNAKKDEISISTDPDEDSVKIKNALHGNRNKGSDLNNANNAEGFKIEGILKGNVNKINSNTNVDKLSIDGTINGVATKGNNSPTANDIKININRNKDDDKENKNPRSGTINLRGKAKDKAINLNKNRKEGTINLRRKAKDNKINIGGTPEQDTANDTSKELKININSKPTDDAKQDESKDASDNLKININNKAEEDTGKNDSSKEAPKESSSAASKDANIDINSKTKGDAPKNDFAGTNNNSTKSANAPNPEPVNDSKPNNISGRSAMMNTPSPGNGNPAMRNNMMMNASL